MYVLGHTMLCPCGKEATHQNSCFNCSLSKNYLDEYPSLNKILDLGSIEKLQIPISAAKLGALVAICQKCSSLTKITIVSLLKQIKRNIKNKAYFFYQCHTCSKAGKSGISTNNVLKLINLDLTIQKFGGLPDNIKKGMVVAQCEDCKGLFDVKMGSLLHQARRHKLNGRTCIYKCFKCGVRRPDALEKSSASRALQLQEGHISGLEKAMGNRLDYLGIKFESQFRLDMYVWDFFLPDQKLLIDVNGEYWHSLPKNLSKDKAKITYTERYHSEYKILVVQEKNFLNPLRVDKILQEKLGITSEIPLIDFDFSVVNIVQLPIGSKYSTPYATFLNSYHYACCGRSGKVVFGAFLGSELIAVCKFSSVVRNEVASSMKLKCTQVMELDRFCIHPTYQKKNFASWFISRCSKNIFTSYQNILGLASFADSTFGHSGTIYKASNWTEVGQTKPSYHYMDDLGIPINKKRVYDIASKLCMKEAEYVQKHNLVKYKELPKTKFILLRK